MTHPDDGALLDVALAASEDERSRDEAPAAAVLRHLRDCQDCTRSVQRYRQTVQLLREEKTPSFGPPPPGTWSAIVAELRSEPDSAAARQAFADTAVSGAQEPLTGTRLGARSHRTSAPVSDIGGGSRGRRWPWLAGGVAAGLATGLFVGTLGMNRDEAPPDTPTPAAQVLARADLAPPQGGPTDGQARLTRQAGVDHLDVYVSGMKALSGAEVYEVWLINRDGTRMVSVGVMPDGAQAQFPVPSSLLDQGYDTVDVSGEPLDEDSAHSGNSMLRGRLRA